MSDEPNVIDHISDYLRLSREAFALLQSGLALLPKGNRREEAEQRAKAAEEALKRADVALASQLRMKLCDCTFPPQIMLWREKEKAHLCPNPECGRTIKPPPRRQPTKSSIMKR